jgi:tRNA A-37 threonylcarbamoyl transferase component Bud32
MSLLSWLRDAFAARPPSVEPEAELPAEEAFLRNLLARVTDPNEESKVGVGDREFWAAVQRLLATGREHTAIDILSRFVAARPDDHTVAARLVEILCDRLEHQKAHPLLERLATVREHALRARFLLADAAERAGDEAEARRQLERILAVELDYPQARGRADRLARALPAPPPALPVAAPTLAGLPDGGADLGRWRLLRELGRGASGAVYVARDEELDRELALKILHPHTRERERELVRARAWLEARLAAAIRHPGVVAIYDLDEERQLLAMELCAGGALAARLRAGPLLPTAALVRAHELLATLAAVHARGIVHGDVKPANLLFRDAGDDAELVLGDFGLAQLGGDDAGAAGRAARGTLAYMAPEQRRGALSPAVDVYAAGVITVELLSGSAALAPWLGDRAALLRGEARWSGALPSSVAAALGPTRAGALGELLRALLADDASARPSATAAAAALARLGEAEPAC